MAGCSRFQFKPRGLAYFSVNVACKGLNGFESLLDSFSWGGILNWNMVSRVR